MRFSNSWQIVFGIVLALAVTLEARRQSITFSQGQLAEVQSLPPEPCESGVLVKRSTPAPAQVFVCQQGAWYALVISTSTQTPSPVTSWLDFQGVSSVLNPPAATQRLYASNLTGITKFVTRGAGGNELVMHEDVVTNARNETGATIPRGRVVRAIGAFSSLPAPALLVEPALADGVGTTRVHGLVVPPGGLANMATQLVQTHGKMFNLDTSAWAAGDTLYVSSTSAGELTNVKPLMYPVRIGRVLRSDATTGALYIDIEQLPETPITYRTVLASDVANTGPANIYADCTGLTFPVTSGVQRRWRALIAYTAAATTTGSAWAINGPATTALTYQGHWQAPGGETVSYQTGYNLPANANAGSPGGTSGQIATLTGVVTPSASGTVVIRFATEVNGSAVTCKAGSTVEWW